MQKKRDGSISILKQKIYTTPSPPKTQGSLHKRGQKEPHVVGKLHIWPQLLWHSMHKNYAGHGQTNTSIKKWVVHTIPVSCWERQGMYCLNLYNSNVLTIFQGKDKHPSMFALYRLTIFLGGGGGTNVGREGSYIWEVFYTGMDMIRTHGRNDCLVVFKELIKYNRKKIYNTLWLVSLSFLIFHPSLSAWFFLKNSFFLLMTCCFIL